MFSLIIENETTLQNNEVIQFIIIYIVLGTLILNKLIF